MWLMVLEFTLKVWGVIMRHCLNIKGIDHNKIQFHNPNLTLIFKKELEEHLNNETPLALELWQNELAKASDQVVEEMKRKREAQKAELARKISDETSHSYVHRVSVPKNPISKATASIASDLFPITESEQILEQERIKRSKVETYDPSTDIETVLGLAQQFNEGILSSSTESDVSKILDLSAYVNSDLVNTSNQTFVLEVGEPIPTLTAESPKSEITLARNTKTIKEQTKSQIKRQVEASNKRRKSKKAKLGKAKVKKVSKTNR
jgi:hypothetical protein